MLLNFDMYYIIADTLKDILAVLQDFRKEQLADKKKDDSDAVEFLSAMSVVVRLYPCSRVTQALIMLR